MTNFDRVAQALKYIDGHLDAQMRVDSLAEIFHFSPYYFHRVFTAITGKALAAYIRDRRLQHACVLLSKTNRTMLDIGLDCGYDSAQSFSRAFRQYIGMPPGEYRRLGLTPLVTDVDDMIVKFTNRLKGGVLVNPKIIKRDKLIIAGVSGDGHKTVEVWDTFMALAQTVTLTNKLSANGYEVRIYDETGCAVHVGYAVSDDHIDQRLTAVTLPASHYAAFDVYPAKGYESENGAMDEWLKTNEAGYTQKLFHGKPYAVVFYDERFKGNETESIVEIWVPIEKK